MCDCVDVCVVVECVPLLFVVEVGWIACGSAVFVTEIFRFWIVIVPPLAKSSGGISIGKLAKSIRNKNLYNKRMNYDISLTSTC